MLQIMSKLRNHQRKEFNLQRLFDLMKKKLYIIIKKKKNQKQD